MDTCNGYMHYWSDDSYSSGNYPCPGPEKCPDSKLPAGIQHLTHAQAESMAKTAAERERIEKLAEDRVLPHLTPLNRVLQDVVIERKRQDAKWGEQNHLDFTWLAILMEEVGESAQEVLTQAFGAAGNGHGDLREELVQVAAVAVAWIEALDRRTG